MSKLINFEEQNLSFLRKKIEHDLCIMPECTSKRWAPMYRCAACLDPKNVDVDNFPKIKITIGFEYEAGELYGVQFYSPVDFVAERRLKQHSKTTIWKQVEIDYLTLDEMLAAQNILRENLVYPQEIEDKANLRQEEIRTAIDSDRMEDPRLGSQAQTADTPFIVTQLLLKMFKDGNLQELVDGIKD